MIDGMGIENFWLFLVWYWQYTQQQSYTFNFAIFFIWKYV